MGRDTAKTNNRKMNCDHCLDGGRIIYLNSTKTKTMCLDCKTIMGNLIKNE